MTNQTTNNRDSFIFYRSFFMATKCLKNEEKAQLFDAICSYALDGEINDLDGTAFGMFQLIKPQLDANRKRFENGCVKKQKISKTEAKPKQKISKTEANVNVNVNDNVNDNVNVNNNLNLNTNENNNLNNKPNKIVTIEKSDLDIFCEDVVNGFQSILEDKMQRKITTNNWQKDIKLLITKDLQPRGEEQAKQDVINCIQAIADNWKANYFPEVQSASAFREKFTKIENFLTRKKPLTKQQQLDLERKEQHDRLAKFYSNQ
jgi:hypothetical protein